MEYYREVGSDGVDITKVDLAAKLADRFCGLNFIEKPKVRWIRPSDPDGATFEDDQVIFGLAGRGEIILRSDLPDIEFFAEVVLHELRHLLQFASNSQHSNHERQAFEFGRNGYREGFGDLIGQAKSLEGFIEFARKERR